MTHSGHEPTTGHAGHDDGPIRNPWRTAAWSIAALVLLIPLVAMQVSDEVDWSVADFVLAGALLLGVGVPLEVAVSRASDAAYRWGAGLALAAAVLLVWLSLGVGIIGADGDPANVLYGGVLAVGIVGALVARFRPHGMAHAMAATALAQAAVAVGAAVAGLGSPYSGPLEIVGLNGLFVALWAASAVLFHRSAGEQPPGAERPEDRPPLDAPAHPPGP